MQPNMKMLFYDLEVSREIVAGYGNKWDFKVVKTLRHQELMCFAYKWAGENKIHYVSRHDFKTYRELVQFLADLQDTADVIVAHNANKFDNKMSNRLFVKENVLPPSPYKTVDTLQVARSKFKFQSNSLKDLAEYLELGEKESVTYADLEDDFMTDAPSRKTLKAMEKYNKMDVEILEKIYHKLRPFMTNHPNVGDISQQDQCCPKCGSYDLEKRGFTKNRNGTKQRYQCRGCGGWSSEAKLRTLGRIVNAI